MQVMYKMIYLCGLFLGSQSYPHVESSDSEQPSAETEIESSDSDDNVEDLNNENDEEFQLLLMRMVLKIGFQNVMRSRNLIQVNTLQLWKIHMLFIGNMGKFATFMCVSQMKNQMQKGSCRLNIYNVIGVAPPIRADLSVWKMVLRKFKGKQLLADAISKQ